MFSPMELISMKPTTGAGERTGDDITQLFAATFLPGGVVKTRIQRQASRTSHMLDAACYS